MPFGKDDGNCRSEALQYRPLCLLAHATVWTMKSNQKKPDVQKSRQAVIASTLVASDVAEV